MAMLKQTKEAEEYKIMKEAVSILYQLYHYKGGAESWEEFMQAEIQLAEYAHKHESKIFEEE